MFFLFFLSLYFVNLWRIAFVKSKECKRYCKPPVTSCCKPTISCKGLIAMSNEKASDSIIPFITIKEVTAGQTSSVKPLYKLKINDLLKIPFNEETDDFTFRTRKISLVMFGGKIESISSDNTIFSFYVNDGTGEIQCYYKCKECISSFMDQMNRISNRAPEVVDDISSSSDSDDEDCNEKVDNSVSEVYAKESKELISDVLSWFNDEVLAVAAEKYKNVGDIIHISGQLLESNSVRKVNVMDFRIVENEIEHTDFLLEVEYLYKNLY